MSKTDTSPKIEIDQVMLAMDVVDTLRHQQDLVDRELSSDERDRALIEKVKRMYASQGLEVTDEIIAEGVAALREDRFAYRPPPPRGSMWLARLYVNRGYWAKVGTVLAALILAGSLIYHFAYVRPESVKRSQLAVLPQKLAIQRKHLLNESKEDAARRQAEKLYADTLAALNSGNVEGAFKGSAALQQLQEQILREYEIRIVSKPGTPSGVWRQPQNRPGVRNYYLIVEAVTPKGERLTLPITSEEDGTTKNVQQWGIRVNSATFDKIRRDKTDDGIIQNNRLGVKERGYLNPQYLMPTTGGAITKW